MISMPWIATTHWRLVLVSNSGLLGRLLLPLWAYRLVPTTIKQSPVLLLHGFELVAFVDLRLSDRLTKVKNMLAISFV